MQTDLRERLERALGGAYTIERELGGGGMSRVFLATDAALGRPVVVKLLPPELAAGLSAERFTREIRLAAALQDPHIVPVLAAGTTADGLPYYTMPYVAGESLRARLSRGSVPLHEAVAILRDVAAALEYAHGRRLVHRDVKPENVLLSGRRAVVTDFGIAKALRAATTQAPEGPALAPESSSGTLTQVGTSLGTPAYMAPEQAAGEPDVDARADLYAWGVLAYEVLAARHPFAHRTTGPQLVAAHIGETPRPLGEVAPGVPPALAALVMRCLAKDPGARPATAADLLAALEGTLEGAGEAPQSSRAAPGLARRGRRRRVAGAAAGLAALLLAAGVLAWRGRAGAGATGRAAAASGPVMLAVLPFEHAGPAEQAIFTDGLTDAVTAKLGALPGLAVIDRGSAAQYRARTKPAKQVGAELGVTYLVDGVVRWARDASGAWRAQVTPTLVDARSGTTRWTGAPQVVTPVDPFSAQGEIATDVAQALEVQLRPVDRAGLAHRMTGHPEAFAAYVRGMAAFDAARAVSSSGVADWSDVVRHRQRAAAEFARAVALDSTFGEAWALLAQMEAVIATLSSSDPAKAAAAARARAALARALAHAPDRPRTLLVLSHVRSTLDGDTTGQDTLVARALARGGNDPEVLIWVSQHRVRQGRPDEAHALTRRAAALDPRSAFYLDQVVQSALRSRRWDEARRAADALIALDSADPRGWARRFAQATLRGDTLEIQRLMPQALATVPRPEHRLLQYMSLAGPAYARRYLGLSAGELNVRSLADSAQYYDNKASTLLHLGDRARARVYYDSVRTVLAGLSPRHGPFRSLVQMRAAAEAMAGDTAAARRSLAAILAAAPPGAGPSTHLGGLLDPVRAATVYARLGEPETAVRWLAAGLGRPWSARGYALMPELRILRGRPAFERLLREHPE